VRVTDRSINWWRVTVLVSVAVIALAIFRWVAVPSVPAQPIPLPPQRVAEAPYEVEPSPGCRNFTGADDSAPPAGRKAAPPARPVPYFATRTGALPPDGPATVGGVELPRGSRCAHRWATDEPVAEAAALADRLAAVFPETGLWPVLWIGDPDEYDDDLAEPVAAVARLDAETVLRRAERSYRMPGDPPFRGLARGTAWVGGDGFAPFATLTRAWAAQDWREQQATFLVLVPCNRPADALSLLGQPESELIGNAAVSAVLRSWEERYGAVPAVVGPGMLDAVAATAPEDTLALAVEQHAIAPESEIGTAREIATQLQSMQRGAFTTPRHWVFGWPD
jgi:hypothetical protein